MNITVLTDPTIRLASAPAFYKHPKYELPDFDNQTEGLIAFAGKVCYDSYGKDGNKVEQHVKNLVRQGHASVLEHASFGFFIEGISRGCSHELVRHRHFSFSQRSTRYTEEGDAACVLDPFYAAIFLKDTAERTPLEDSLLTNFLDHFTSSLDIYTHQVECLEQMAPATLNARDKRKWARGKARQVLPHALETRMVMTGNVRTWIEFLLKRTNRHAEAEMRRLAHMLWEMLQTLVPNAFTAVVGQTIDGYVELTVEL